MSMSDLGVQLRAKLGPAACDDLVVALEEAKSDMLEASQQRFESRMDARFTAFSAEIRGEIRGELVRTEAALRQEITNVDANLRVAMSEGFAKLRSEMSEMRVDVLRWSFLFWIGQLVALGSLMTVLLRGVAH